METNEPRPLAYREKLPDTRESITHHFEITAPTKDGDGIEVIDGYLQAGEYLDGRLGEIFIRIGKPGTEFAMLDQWALAFSMALQYGTPVEVLCQKFVGARFWPGGYTRNPNIKQCTSIVDYVARWLLMKYGPSQSPSIEAPAQEGT